MRALARAPLISVASALLAFAVLMGVAMERAGWVFEYPLDDVYIHMAMAEQIAAGGYGVNAGELASAASSPLYPLLLLPGAGTEFQRYLPLFWNVVALIAVAWLWARILIRAGLFEPDRAWLGWAAAVLGPVMINSFGLAFVGMEHTLHMAASLAIVLGLLRLVQDEEIGLTLLVGLLLTTALRLEGLALGLMAAFVIWRIKGELPALLCAGLTLAPVAAFILVLASMGLDPLPESVQAKLHDNDTIELGWVERFLAQFQVNIAKPAGLTLLLGSGVLLILMRAVPAMRQTGPRSFGLAILAATLAHLFFGQIGWMDRYEGYIWACLAAGILVISAWGGRVLPAAGLAVVVAGGLSAYWISWTQHFPWNIRAIHLQPAQSARFAQDFAQVPVAVNDLGRAAWANPNYVLDLYGLASAEARYHRTYDPSPGWAAPLAEKHGVRIAMIYDKWLGEAVGEDWVRLGELHIIPGEGYLGDSKVAYYATAPEYVADLEAALADWVPTLPEGAEWRPEGAE